MQSLTYDTSGTETIAVWPEVTSSFFNNPLASFQMILSSDYGLQEQIVDLTLTEAPTPIHQRIIFTFDKADLPNYTGNYTFTIREEIPSNETWGTISETWASYDVKWSADVEPVLFTIETDRAWIQGNDEPTFTQYDVPATPGEYTIYHN